MTQGGVEYKFTILRGTDEGLDLWEAGYIKRPITSIRELLLASKETNLLKPNHGELKNSTLCCLKKGDIS
jgi:hypothetical protein